jgi:hypothetical protein
MPLIFLILIALAAAGHAFPHTIRTERPVISAPASLALPTLAVGPGAGASMAVHSLFTLRCEIPREEERTGTAKVSRLVLRGLKAPADHSLAFAPANKA